MDNLVLSNNNKNFFPMLVSSNQGITDSPNEIVNRWKKFKALPEKSRMILIAEETPVVIQEIANKHQISSLHVGEISRIIRSFFFGEISQGNIANELKNKIPTLSFEDIQGITQEIIKKIINASPKTTTAKNYNVINLPLSQALQKYPALGEKLITSNPIRIKFFPSPVRPSIKNWITDYHTEVGAGSHGTMERGNYLYHSDNAKNLTASERQKLAVILKSIDENEPVAIDPEKQEIVFNRQPTTNPEGKKTSYGAGNQQRKESGQWSVVGGQSRDSAVRFSYPQKLSSEFFQSRPELSKPPVAPPMPPVKNKPETRYNPYQIHHLSPNGTMNNSKVEENENNNEPKIKGNVVDLRN